MKFACFAGEKGPQLGAVDAVQGIIRPMPTRDMVDLITRYTEIRALLSTADVAQPLSSTVNLPNATFTPVDDETPVIFTQKSMKVVSTIPVLFEDYGIANPSFGVVATEDNGLVEFVLVFERA